MATINKKYSYQQEVKDQFLSIHRKYVLDRKGFFYMVNNLKDVKIPKKKSVGRKEDPMRVVDNSSRYLCQLQRERQKDPIRLSQKVQSVKVVVDVCDYIEMDMMQCVGSIDSFENNMRERMKKYKRRLEGKVGQGEYEGDY
eukprot:1822700-Ditylum_brightwellii.AAC.1